MSLIGNCPECHTRPKWNGTVSHSPECTRIDFESAKWYALKYRETQIKANERVNAFVEKALRWEGKFRIICHENNQLRRKLPAK